MQKNYNNIDWIKCKNDVMKIQNQVVVAYKNGNSEQVTNYQNAIVRSFAARALAVRKVNTNCGGKTAGIDEVIWSKPEQRMEAIDKLKNLSKYKAKPVKRVWITKPNGEKRPLGIPTMFDRAVQALYVQALNPIAEECADKCSYGFRPHRSTKDAAIYLKLVLGSITATRRWIFLCDVEKYFDQISHKWVLDNIPLNKKMLKEFVKSGVIEKGMFEKTEKGTPQGGVISPVIANMVLDGLEECLGKEFLVVRYADDFVVLWKTKESLSIVAKKRINEFLQKRGVRLNMEKSRIVEVSEGFDYLGFHFREYKDSTRVKGRKKGIMLIKPAKENIKDCKNKVKDKIKMQKSLPLYLVISKINEIIRGWAEYYRATTAKKIFSSLGAYIWKIAWKMLKRKNRKLGLRKLKKKYFTSVEGNSWVLKSNDPKGKPILLFQMGWVKIKRHWLIKNLNPYLAENLPYYVKRVESNARSNISLPKRKSKLLIKQRGICPVCKEMLWNGEDLEVHHRNAKKKGGLDIQKNLLLLHKTCHKQVTNSKNENLKAVWVKQKIVETSN